MGLDFFMTGPLAAGRTGFRWYLFLYRPHPLPVGSREFSQNVRSVVLE
jgi:hypothetical protein